MPLSSMLIVTIDYCLTVLFYNAVLITDMCSLGMCMWFEGNTYLQRGLSKGANDRTIFRSIGERSREESGRQ